MSEKKSKTCAVGRPMKSFDMEEQRSQPSHCPPKSSEEENSSPRGCDYDQQLIKRFYRTIRVAAVLPPGGNAPWISVNGSTIQGADVDLLKAVLGRVPGIENVIVFPKPDLEAALEALIVGQDPTLVIGHNPITPVALFNQVAALATDAASTASGVASQLLIYESGPNCTSDPCSVASLLLAHPGINPLTAIGTPSGSPGCSTPDVQLLVPSTNIVGQQLITTLNTGTSPANVIVLGGVSSPNIPTLVSQLTTLFGSVGAPSTCQVALLIPNTFSASQLAQLQAALAAAGFAAAPVSNATTPSATVLAFGWYFLKFASRFGLTLQAAFDAVVASGEYRRILRRWGLTPETIAPGALFSAAVIPSPLYSLEQGFIPQVAVYEQFLPEFPAPESQGKKGHESRSDCLSIILATSAPSAVITTV